jgi:hypothetical protein
MTKQNFEKQKVQVQYTPRFTFANNATIAAYDKKKGGSPAQDLIDKIKKMPDDFTFTGELDKTGKLAKIAKITFPQINNGHVEQEGWGWQLDVKEVGSGSKSRLVLACKPGANVTIAQKEADKPVRIGKEDYKVIQATLTLNGTFRAIENSK